MSNATEADLQAYLDQLSIELNDAISKGRESSMAAMSARGLLNSGAAIKNGVAALEKTVSEHLTGTMMLVDRWAGPNLPRDRTRELISSYMRTVIDKFIRPEHAYRMGSRLAGFASIQEAFDKLIEASKAKLSARVREFELGAEKDPDYIRSLLEKLVEDIQDQSRELAEQIAPDTETISSQLKKPEPSLSIMREAGQSIRTIVEGAAGGAIGNAMSPSVAKTFELLIKALGIG